MPLVYYRYEIRSDRARLGDCLVKLVMLKARNQTSDVRHRAPLTTAVSCLCPR